MFPQLPVTQPPCLSASTSLFLYLASSNQRLIKVSTVTSYQLHHFLPHLYVFSSPCLPIIYYSLTSRNERLTNVPTVTSYQLHPFLPHLYVFSSPCLPIINYSLASRNVRLTKVPTVTSYPTTLVSVRPHHSFSLWCPHHILLFCFEE